MSKKVIFIGGLVFLAALSRLLPHPPNFTAVASIGLFAGALLGSRFLKVFIPFIAMFITDLFINNVVYADYQDGFTFFTEGFVFIYFPILLIALFGNKLVQKLNIKNIVVGSVLSSAIFFLISNFGVWVSGTTYPISAEGFIACYTAAIPFFANTLIGTLFFSGVIFGAYQLAEKHAPSLVKA